MRSFMYIIEIVVYFLKLFIYICKKYESEQFGTKDIGEIIIRYRGET